MSRDIRRSLFVWSIIAPGFFIAPSSLFTQPVSADVRFYISKTVEKAQSAEWDSVRYFNKAVDSLLQKSDSLGRWISHYTEIGFKICYRKQNGAALALEFLQIPVNQAFRNPHTVNEWESLGYLHLYIAIIYNLPPQNLLRARHHYDACRVIWQNNLHRKDPFLARYVLRPLGDTYARLRDFDKASHYFEEGKAILVERKMWNEAAMANNSFGMMLSTFKKDQQSIRLYGEGLGFPGLTPDTKAFLHINLGMSLIKTDQIDEALHETIVAQHILDTYSDSMTSSHLFEHLGDLHENFGAICRIKGRWQESAEHYRKKIAYYLKKYEGVCNRDVAQSYNALSGLFNEWGRPDSALRYAQQALRCLLPSFHPKDDFAEPLFEDIYAEHAFYLVFEQKVKAYTILSTQYPSDTSYLLHCLRACDLLFHTGEILRKEYDFEPTKLYRQQVNRQYFETALSACYRLWQQTQNPSWAERAFQYADLARERVQVEGLQDLEKLDLTGLPKQQLDSLRDRQIRIQTWLFENGGSASARVTDSLKSVLFYTSLAYQDLLKTVRVADDAAPAVRIPWVNLDKVRARILPDQALIEYFLGDSAIYVFTLTEQDIRVWSTPVPSGLQTALNNLTKSLTNDIMRHSFADTPLFGESADRLYDWLLAEPLQSLGQNINKLIIVPDGALCQLPFEVLGKRPEKIDFHSYPYLLRNYAVSYAYSSALMLMQAARAEQAKSNPGLKLFAGFAATYDAGGDTLDKYASRARIQLEREGKYNLPGAIKEVEDIAKMLNGQAFIGRDASVQAFKIQSPWFRILHFAMHAVMDHRDPMFSKLLFTQWESPDTANQYAGRNGDLNAIELYYMNLPAEMAVLSACNTGMGVLHQGEGVMSLSRAFSMAGVPATVMSLWKAHDDATQQIMVSFYRYLQEPGMRKDEALRKAKLYFLAQCPPEMRSPFYWAGFIGAGEMKAIY